MSFIDEIIEDRDAWKAIAEKLAEALKANMNWIGRPPTDPYSYDSIREEGWQKGTEALTVYHAALEGKEGEK